MYARNQPFLLPPNIFFEQRDVEVSELLSTMGLYKAVVAAHIVKHLLVFRGVVPFLKLLLIIYFLWTYFFICHICAMHRRITPIVALPILSRPE
jgi:hypothetical protein